MYCHSYRIIVEYVHVQGVLEVSLLRPLFILLFKREHLLGCVLPYLSYGIFIWGGTYQCYLNKIVKLQK